MTAHRLAVWGDPISHSRSPLLHAAAYRALGLGWEYGRRQVDVAGFTAAYESLDNSWRGLSVTMPLKEQAFALAVHHDRHAALTGAVNTLLLGEQVAGFNTDVGGIIDTFRENGIAHAAKARILGAGATAASAVAAVYELGVHEVDVRARRTERAQTLRALGESLGIRVTVTDFSAPVSAVDLTIATLPSGTVLDDATAAALGGAGGALLDAAYAPWPSALAAKWPGSAPISGLEMLLHQALRQVRVFVDGDPLRPLENETFVRDEMRLAVMGD